MKSYIKLIASFLFGIFIIYVFNIFFCLVKINECEKNILLLWNNIEKTTLARNKILPCIVREVKSYIPREKYIFMKLYDASGKFETACVTDKNDIAYKIKALNTLNAAINEMLMISESVDELMVNKKYMTLIKEFSVIGCELNSDIKKFNKEVKYCKEEFRYGLSYLYKSNCMQYPKICRIYNLSKCEKTD